MDVGEISQMLVVNQVSKHIITSSPSEFLAQIQNPAFAQRHPTSLVLDTAWDWLATRLEL